VNPIKRNTLRQCASRPLAGGAVRLRRRSMRNPAHFSPVAKQLAAGFDLPPGTAVVIRACAVSCARQSSLRMMWRMQGFV
jgi:hypothetical protein